MKSSSTPCPLDQIPVICLKRCPYLRTYVTALIGESWRQRTIPIPWKKGATILIYKAGATDNPANFRPITLQPVCLKILTSLTRDRIYQFLGQNGYIERPIQKGFVPGLSGTFEHTANLSNIINQARLKQRSLTVTLLDLKNAFREVHHNLIRCVLQYHHVPSEVQLLEEV